MSIDKKKLLHNLKLLNEEARKESGHSLKDIQATQDISDKLADEARERLQNFDFAKYAQALLEYLIESESFLRPKPRQPKTIKNDPSQFQQ